MNDDPYHEGARGIQERTGQRAAALANGRVIRDAIPAAAASFVALQRICVIAATDGDGAPWVTCVVGAPGFAAVSENLRAVSMRIEDPDAILARTPPLMDLDDGDALGLLFIDPATRRRLRVNGQVSTHSDGQLLVAVQEAFPNCPKYIHRRVPAETIAPRAHTRIESGTAIDDTFADWIARTDTLFVASAHPDGRIDASHRGGAPGFVNLIDGVLHVPDYHGNSMFKTLGNFALNPRAGLCLVDFDRGSQLLLTGESRLLFDEPTGPDSTGGTGHWWVFRPQHWISAPWNLSLAWRYQDASPFNP